MARQPMVTRTIKTTKVNVMCVDINSGETFNEEVVLPRTYKDDAKLLAKVGDILNNEVRKAVHIVKKEELETLYGMTEQKFIDSAEILDKETRKTADTDTDK